MLECAKPNKRDYAIIQVLLQTGITLSELTRLTLNDLEITDKADKKGNKIEYVRIISSQRTKSRMIPVDFKAGIAIGNYLSIRGKTSLSNLFLNRLGERLGEREVEKIIEKYLKLAGIADASVNSLRHTFGTFQAVKGTSKKVIQKVMGHRDIRTTGRYYLFAWEIYPQKKANFLLTS